MTGEVMVDTSAVAVHFSVTERTVRNWVDREGLPAYRLGGLLKFRLSEVVRWAESRRVEGRSSEA